MTILDCVETPYGPEYIVAKNGTVQHVQLSATPSFGVDMEYAPSGPSHFRWVYNRIMAMLKARPKDTWVGVNKLQKCARSTRVLRMVLDDMVTQLHLTRSTPENVFAAGGQRTVLYRLSNLLHPDGHVQHQAPLRIFHETQPVHLDTGVVWYRAPCYHVSSRHMPARVVLALSAHDMRYESQVIELRAFSKALWGILESANYHLDPTIFSGAHHASQFVVSVCCVVQEETTSILQCGPMRIRVNDEVRSVQHTTEDCDEVAMLRDSGVTVRHRKGRDDDDLFVNGYTSMTRGVGPDTLGLSKTSHIVLAAPDHKIDICFMPDVRFRTSWASAVIIS